LQKKGNEVLQGLSMRKAQELRIAIKTKNQSFGGSPPYTSNGILTEIIPAI
jgi:hypothetical protein